MFFSQNKISLLLGLSSAVVMPFLAPNPSKAQPAFASLVCVFNETNDDVEFEYKWSDPHSPWRVIWLEAGESYRFWWEFEYPDEMRSPYFLASLYTNNQGRLDYHIEGYAATITSDCEEASYVYINEIDGRFYVDGDEVFIGN